MNIIYEGFYNKLINEAKVIAIKSLKNFFEHIDLNVDTFSHIYNIPIEIKTIENAIAQYFIDEYVIVVNKKYLFEKVNIIMADYSLLKNQVLEIAVTLVHEYIHVNRTMIINNALSIDNVIEKREQLLLELENIKNGYNLNLYDELLIKVLNEGNKYYTNKYIPLKITKNNDGISIIAYNCETTNYEEIKDFTFTIDCPVDFNKISEKLNSLNMDCKNNKIIRKFFSYQNEDENLLTISDYNVLNYNEFEYISYLFFNIKDYFFVKKQIEKICVESVKKIKYQNSLEEIITEVLANIIVMTRKDANLDIFSTATKIMNSTVTSFDEKIGARIIRYLDKDMLRWFMLSAYEECYDDKLSKLFEEKYELFLFYINNIYNSIKYEKKVDLFNYLNANKIVEEKMKKKKI